jgi:mono/diheme cytochrome c family protein
MRIVGTILGLVILGILTAALFIYSGWYDVAASKPHLALTSHLLHTTMERSVAVRAADIQPPDLSGQDLIKKGAEHYHRNCAVCHGAPGIPLGKIGKGLMPQPPELAKKAGEWTSAELYWIVKHGIKMTGMPAWGKTHKEEDLWAIVAFTERLPNMSANEYRQWVPDASASRGTEHADRAASSATHSR